MSAQQLNIPKYLHRLLANALLDESFEERIALPRLRRDVVDTLKGIDTVPLSTLIASVAENIYGEDYINVISARMPSGIHQAADRMQDPPDLMGRVNLWLAIRNSLNEAALDKIGLSETIGALGFRDLSAQSLEANIRTLAHLLGGYIYLPPLFEKHPTAWFALQSQVPIPHSSFSPRALTESQVRAIEFALNDNTEAMAPHLIYLALYDTEMGYSSYRIASIGPRKDVGRAFASFSDAPLSPKSKAPWIVAGVAAGVGVLIYLATRPPRRQPV